MDALKYFEEKRRMLNSLGRKEGVCFGVRCDKCYFKTKTGCIVHQIESVEIVEKWSAENPQKTILLDFLEKYPSVNVYAIVGIICPDQLGYVKNENCLGNGECYACWNRPLVEEV